ncbi:hypothetical protein [Conexibacter woesei]|uniref:hypothetical protein n=1 Tax=Conexibacter woesei TaxID=191495 RepID=UPI00047C1E0B|nr:hypothetical protein [Conexibacter woesei]
MTVRKLMLSFLSALCLAAAAPAAGQADTLELRGAAVPFGAAVGLNAPLVRIDNLLPGPITCTASNISLRVQVNGVMGNPAEADVNAWVFGGCSNPILGACALTTTGLPWPVGARMWTTGGVFKLNFGTNQIAVRCGATTCLVSAAGGALQLAGLWADGTAATPATVTYNRTGLQILPGSARACNAFPDYTATYSTAGNDYSLV